MKIRLLVSEKHYREVENELTSKGFEIDEDADYLLLEKGLYADHLIVKDKKDGDRSRIAVGDIVFIESFGHEITIHAAQGDFFTNERLYQLERILNPEQFLRISNSVIISRQKVKRIKPALSSKFILIMSNDMLVDVTRSYYNIFRDSFGI